MLLTFLLMFALQTAAIGPRGGSSPVPDGSCVILELTGQLVFPAFVAPVHFVRIELQKLDPYSSVRETFTGPYEQFNFYGLTSGEYDLRIIMDGMDVVQQSLHLGKDVCVPTPGAHTVVPLHISPAIKPSPIAEDAIAIEALLTKTPSRTVNALEKAQDKESALLDILKTAPDYYDANLELGLHYKKANQRDESTRLLTHALEVNSASMLARSALGQYRFEAGDFEEASHLLSEAVRLGSISPDVYYMLGTAYYKLESLDMAEASLLRALDLDPGIGKAHLQLYNVYMKGKLPKKALAEAKTYLDNYPNAGDRDYVRSMVEKHEPAIAPATESDRPKPIADPELDAAIHRATDYVVKYEAELGNLIGSESYLQTDAWDTRSLNESRTPGPGFRRPVPRRLTSSDFMLINVGSQWVALREVNTVNGMKVKREQPPFESAFNDSPEDNTKRFNSMKADSTRYNIGNILREINLPTFALEVLRKDQVGRFSFEKDGSDKINGVPVWRIKFREITAPTLVSTRDGKQDLYSTGTLWIEAETGRVLKTEFHIDNHLANPTISANVVVAYSHDKSLNMLLPATMAEHYETAAEAIDCQAEYSRFRRFTVDVKFGPGMGRR